MTNVHRPIWIDDSSRDPDAIRAFYADLFGWAMVASDDPQYAGYATARLDGNDVAGFGGQQDPNLPGSVWSLYIATTDAAATCEAATAAGGQVIKPPFPIGALGTSAFIADPLGAVLGLWQSDQMTGFGIQGRDAFGWGELNARGVASVIPFYERVFGWTRRTSDMGDGRTYTEFLDGEESLLGAFEMAPQVPAEVPNHWLVYFAVDDVAATHDAAVAAGGSSIMSATVMPGGTYGVATDPLGGTFGLLTPEG